MAKKVEAPVKKAAAAKKSPAPASKRAPAAAKKTSTAPARPAASTKSPAKTSAKSAPKAAAATPKKGIAASKATNNSKVAPAPVVKAAKPAPGAKSPAPAKKVAAKAPAAAKHDIGKEHKAAATKEAPAPTKAPAKKVAPPPPPAPTMAPVRGETKDGIKYTKDFDAKFLTGQLKLLIEARESLTGQAVRLEDEANSLIDDEMGDVQFDDESGEGDTMVVERERDLFLSARARQDIEEIDAAIERLHTGTYGYSIISMRPIPRERLEAIPWATELTEEKVGGIGRR